MSRRNENECMSKKVKPKKKAHILCPNCVAGCHIGSAGEVYKRRIPGKIRAVLVCDNYPACDSYVSVNLKHGHYGIPANRRVRRLRRYAHHLQDKLIASGKYSRDELYSLIRKDYGLISSRAHIRFFDEKMCNRLIAKYMQLLGTR